MYYNDTFLLLQNILIQSMPGNLCPVLRCGGIRPRRLRAIKISYRLFCYITKGISYRLEFFFNRTYFLQIYKHKFIQRLPLNNISICIGMKDMRMASTTLKEICQIEFMLLLEGSSRFKAVLSRPCRSYTLWGLHFILGAQAPIGVERTAMSESFCRA